MANKSPLKYVSLRTYVDPHKLARLKAKLALARISVSEWVRRKIDEELNDEETPRS